MGLWLGGQSKYGVRVTDSMHHAAVTYQAADDVFRMYVDGQLAVDTRFNVNAFANDQAGEHKPPLHRAGMVQRRPEQPRSYEGLIDDVTLWSAASQRKL